MGRYVKYVMKTPSGVIADGEWESLAAIPERIPDRFERYYNTEDEVVCGVAQSGDIIELDLLGIVRDSAVPES